MANRKLCQIVGLIEGNGGFRLSRRSGHIMTNGRRLCFDSQEKRIDLGREQ